MIFELHFVVGQLTEPWVGDVDSDGGADILGISEGPSAVEVII